MPTIGGRSPWGKIDHIEELGDGIVSVSTPGHGGIWVPARLRKRIVPEFQGIGKGGWFEEDCAWAIVGVSFPDIFGMRYLSLPYRNRDGEFISTEYESALDTLKCWYPREFARWQARMDAS